MLKIDAVFEFEKLDELITQSQTVLGKQTEIFMGTILNQFQDITRTFVKEELAQLIRHRLSSGDPNGLVSLLALLSKAFKCIEAINQKLLQNINTSQSKFNTTLKSVV